MAIAKIQSRKEWYEWHCYWHQCNQKNLWQFELNTWVHWILCHKFFKSEISMLKFGKSIFYLFIITFQFIHAHYVQCISGLINTYSYTLDSTIFASMSPWDKVPFFFVVVADLDSSMTVILKANGTTLFYYYRNLCNWIIISNEKWESIMF